MAMSHSPLLPLVYRPTSILFWKSESETFDLAGQNVSTIEKVIHDAFSEPFSLSEMIRITFVTGAGKLARQKYDDNAAKAVTSTLRDLGYEEDRGASAVMECAGSFKLQHDTGKNLKTVVVFPKVVVAGGSEEESAARGGSSNNADSLLPENSPEHKIAFSSMAVFQRMVASMCPSWAQLKGAVGAIDDIKKVVEGLDAKLLQGNPLSDREQEFYDAVSMSSLEEKNGHVRDLMHQIVEEGRITAAERRMLLAQVRERLDKLSEDIKEAEKEKKPKRVENLTAQKSKAEERKEKIEQLDPKQPHPLKNEGEIAKLRKELGPLLDMEEAAKGRLLTLKESQAIARKDEILEEIAQLEVSCHYERKLSVGIRAASYTANLYDSPGALIAIK